LKGAEVVGLITPFSVGEITVHKDGVTTEETIADPITIEQPSQEELQSVTHTVSPASELVKKNYEALNLAVVTDECDVIHLMRILIPSNTLRKTMKQQVVRAMKS
jgi:hypothetical protein